MDTKIKTHEKPKLPPCRNTPVPATFILLSSKVSRPHALWEEGKLKKKEKETGPLGLDCHRCCSQTAYKSNPLYSLSFSPCAHPLATPGSTAIIMSVENSCEDTPDSPLAINKAPALCGIMSGHEPCWEAQWWVCALVSILHGER